MGWLALGVAYSVVYAVVGGLSSGRFPTSCPGSALSRSLLPPLVGVGMIVRRRHAWAGCQWLFWATLALGLLMSGISVVGWSVDELLLGVSTSWLGLARGVRAVRRSRSAARAAGAAASRRTREGDRDDRRRHRGHRGPHRLSVFALRVGFRSRASSAGRLRIAVAPLRASAVSRLRRHDRRRDPRARSGLEAGVSAAGDRAERCRSSR